MCASLSANGSSRLGRSGVVNLGSTLSVRRYLRTVFLDNPVRRAISRIEKCCRNRQRRMTLSSSMTITPRSLASAEGERFEHGSVLGGKTCAAWVSSQWKSTQKRLGPGVAPPKSVVARQMLVKMLGGEARIARPIKRLDPPLAIGRDALGRNLAKPPIKQPSL